MCLLVRYLNFNACLSLNMDEGGNVYWQWVSWSVELGKGGFLLLRSTMLCKCTMDESSEVKGGRRELLFFPPIQSRSLGVGNVILEHHGVMRPRERVSLAGNLSLWFTIVCWIWLTNSTSCGRWWLLTTAHQGIWQRYMGTWSINDIKDIDPTADGHSLLGSCKRGQQEAVWFQAVWLGWLRVKGDSYGRWVRDSCLVPIWHNENQE